MVTMTSFTRRRDASQALFITHLEAEAWPKGLVSLFYGVVVF